MGKFQRIYWKKNFDWKNYAKIYDNYSKSKGNYYEKSSNQLLQAIDLSAEMVHYYKKNFKNEIKRGQVKVLVGNAEKISDLTNEKYDAVFISSALWDMEISPLFKSLSKVLNENGKIIFNLPALVVERDRGFIYFIEHFFRRALQSDI